MSLGKLIVPDVLEPSRFGIRRVPIVTDVDKPALVRMHRLHRLQIILPTTGDHHGKELRPGRRGADDVDIVPSMLKPDELDIGDRASRGRERPIYVKCEHRHSRSFKASLMFDSLCDVCGGSLYVQTGHPPIGTANQRNPHVRQVAQEITLRAPSASRCTASSELR